MERYNRPGCFRGLPKTTSSVRVGERSWSFFFQVLIHSLKRHAVVKNLSANAGDTREVSLIRGLGRSSGEGNGNPLQYSYLGNPMDRGARWAIYSPWGCQELDTLECMLVRMHARTHTHTHTHTKLDGVLRLERRIYEKEYSHWM